MQLGGWGASDICGEGLNIIILLPPLPFLKAFLGVD